MIVQLIYSWMFFSETSSLEIGKFKNDKPSVKIYTVSVKNRLKDWHKIYQIINEFGTFKITECG